MVPSEGVHEPQRLFWLVTHLTLTGRGAALQVAARTECSSPYREVLVDRLGVP